MHYAGVWLLLAIGTSLSTVAHAGAGVWTSGGPFAGNISALAISPSFPATLYAGMSNGAGVFKSTDSGGTWAATSTGLYPYVKALAINPAIPSTLYAGTYSGLFKSTDSGGTWVPTSLTPSVNVLAVHPAIPSTVYAGTFGGGVWKSTDSGETWAAASVGLTDMVVFALAINPSTPATLYAGLSNGAGVVKSTDSGDSWVPVNVGLSNVGVVALAINPSTPSTLYAGADGGLFKSTDAGGTWTKTNLPWAVDALALNPTIPSTLYAGTSGVFESTDAGGTWVSSNTGLTNLNVRALALNPTTPATLYAGTDGGVFKSIDAGGTWAATNVGLPSMLSVPSLASNPVIPSTVYAGTSDSGVWKSTDSGGRWAPANSGLTSLNVKALALNPTTSATLYAGTNGGVFKSADSGGTWAPANSGLTNLNVNALALNPTTPSTLYAGTDGGVFKSTDAGSSWVSANVGLTSLLSVPALALNPVIPSTCYAGTSGSGVWKSTDSGSTWTPANTGLTNQNILALAINPSSPATLYAGTKGGLFKSIDAGGTWAKTSLPICVLTGGCTFDINALVVNATTPATIYAATDEGVFKSTDAGSTWYPVNVGLPMVPVQALALDPTGATTLYAGLASGGVWQKTPPTSDYTTAFLPTSAHSSGLNGAFYTTNVSIADIGAVTAEFTLKFLGNNQDGSNGPERMYILYPGTSNTFLDVLGSVFSQTSTFGAIRITANASTTLNIVSVTSTPGFGGTFGQTIPAVSSSDLIPADSARSILYIREGDGFRSNLILASNASAITNVDAALVSPAGSTLAMKTYAVPPSGMTQINRVVRDMGVSGPNTGARLVLSSSTPGAAFTGFASVIDETTNDPTTVLVQPASVSGSAPYVWLLPTSSHSPGLNGAFYTTNASVSNVGAAPASFTMKFLGNNQDGSAGPEQTFNLESGRSVTYLDVLGSVFNQTSNFGAIRITSTSPALNIVSITSTPGFGGTFGQTIPAVSSGDLIPTGSSRSILYIREGDGFRSNLILASNGSQSTTVDVALVSPTGTTLATKSYSVPPNGMTQINRIVRDMGVSGSITGARLVLSSSTPNAAFAGFTSVIDETTNDPTTVEAR